MNRLARSIGVSALAAALLATGAFEITAQTKRKPVIRKKAVAAKKPAKPAARLFTVSAGKRIRVRMNETVSSKTA